MLKRYQANDVNQAVKTRRTNYSGNIVFRVSLKGNMISVDGPVARGLCVCCGNKTHHYCLDCKHWLCGPGIQDKKDKKVRFIDDDGTRIVLMNSCWHTFHEEGLNDGA